MRKGRQAALAAIAITALFSLLAKSNHARVRSGPMAARASTLTRAGAAATPTPLCPLGDGHPLLCRGGTEQGKVCSTDSDCGGGICKRHGHPRDCLEQGLYNGDGAGGPGCYGVVARCVLGQCDRGLDGGKACTVDADCRGGALGGQPGDRYADNVVGCSTESNRYALSHPTDARYASDLAFHAGGPGTKDDELWAAQAGLSAVKQWNGSAVYATDQAASRIIGQLNMFQNDEYRLPGDPTITGNAVPYSFSEGVASVAVDPRTGDVWTSDGFYLAKYTHPVAAAGALPVLNLCGPSGVCRADAAAISPGGKLAATDAANSKVYIWLSLPTSDYAAPDITLGSGGCNGGGSASDSTLCGPQSIAWLGEDLVISDSRNRRVLILKAKGGPTYSFPADYVLCQPNFTTTSAGVAANKCEILRQVATYKSGARGDTRLVVVDQLNHRVLGWADPESSQSPTWVWGQTAWTTNSSGVSATSLTYPKGAAFGDKDLFVSDANGRISRFPLPAQTPPKANTSVSWIGQPNSTSNLPQKVNRIGWPLYNGQAAFDSHDGVYLLVPNENLVAYYADKADTHRGVPATKILFQDGGPNDQLANRGGSVSARGINGALSITVDAADHLYVCDTGNNRVLVCNDPSTHGDTQCNRVIGQQGSFTTFSPNSGGVSASSLSHPEGCWVDGSGALWIADTYNHRVKRLLHPRVSDAADIIIGQQSATANNSTGCSSPQATTLCFPHDVARIAPPKKTDYVWITDCGPGEWGACRIVGRVASRIAPINSALDVVLDSGGDQSFGTFSYFTLAGDQSSGNLFAIVSPGIAEFAYPFANNQKPLRCMGMGNCTNRGSGTGYVTDAWSTSNGHIAVEPSTGDVWIPGTGEGGRSTAVVYAPDAPTWTPTVTQTGPPNTPTQTATPANPSPRP